MPMTFETLDDLTYDVEADGTLVRKQLDKVVLTKGAWATVLFLFEERDEATGAWRSPKMSVVRFQKWRGGYRKHSSFNVSSAAEARQLIDVFERWFPKLAEDEDDETSPSPDLADPSP